ncbi:ATP-dependent nuclease [Sphingopyxis sp. H107]|uniref:ATP-dependent nuclease n=1 Tax=Sphingopyxis sp. H107 TaxID=1759082 RepID=UPI001E3F9F61|nr:AAA family ATPase [Sphingopyxis sp. H107]
MEDFWNFKPRGKAIQSHVNEYREKLTLWLTDTVGLPKGSQHPAIWSLIQKSSKPPHVIDQETFYEVFSPVQNSGSILGFSLSTIFSKFIIDEFNWCHNQFEAGRSASKAKSRAIFRKKFQPPWVPINKLLDEMGKMSASREAFRFEITTPDEEHIKIQSIQGYSFVANLRNKISGDICNFDNLSSGEKVLLALVISIYYSNESFMLPKVLLLGEVDASLHPSMIRVLLDAIGRAFVSKGTKVIMATHSPTTVALAPEGALHSVQAGNRQKKIVKISKNEGLSILTEGFATFDEGLEALSFSGDRVIIFTEGSNRKILNRYFNISGLDNIKFIDRLDDKSSKEQLVHYYKLISAIGLNRKILFIWDCDAERQVANLEETEGLFKYVIPRNLNNKIASAGIENAFDEDLLSPHCKRIIDPDGSESLRFDNAEKKRFTEKMAKSEDLASFHRFAGLGDKVRQILSL